MIHERTELLRKLMSGKPDGTVIASNEPGAHPDLMFVDFIDRLIPIRETSFLFPDVNLSKMESAIEPAVDYMLDRKEMGIIDENLAGYYTAGVGENDDFIGFVTDKIGKVVYVVDTKFGIATVRHENQVESDVLEKYNRFVLGLIGVTHVTGLPSHRIYSTQRKLIKTVYHLSLLGIIGFRMSRGSIMWVTEGVMDAPPQMEADAPELERAVRATLRC